ncbi:MAG TPA: GNAT family N-acetyltransferase [Rhizomicrobium sp.]|nr:GNAT family N-acetyltransferase [Rhizomicrobium sp.]
MYAEDHGLSGIRFSLEPISSINRVGTLWRRLEQGSDISFFVSWTWIGTWLRCLPEHVRPQLLIAMRGGDPVAAAILVPHRDRRHWIFRHPQFHFNSTGIPALDCVTIEHNGFAAGPQESRDVWPAFLRWFACEALADELVIPGIESGILDGGAASGDLLQRRARTPAFAGSVAPGGMEAFLSRLSRNSRHQLRRSLRACAALGQVRIESARSAAEAQAWFGELKGLHVGYWTRRGRHHAFYHPFFENFHRALIEAGAEEGSVVLRRISAGNAILGYLHDFRRGDRVYAYQSGFDDARARLRPGYVAHALAMEHTARDGARCYDFLAGDNRLKRSFGDRVYAADRQVFGRPTARLRLEAAALRLSRRCRKADPIDATVPSPT